MHFFVFDVTINSVAELLWLAVKNYKRASLKTCCSNHDFYIVKADENINN